MNFLFLFDFTLFLKKFDFSKFKDAYFYSTLEIMWCKNFLIKVSISEENVIISIFFIFLKFLSNYIRFFSNFFIFSEKIYKLDIYFLFIWANCIGITNSRRAINNVDFWIIKNEESKIVEILISENKMVGIKKRNFHWNQHKILSTKIFWSIQFEGKHFFPMFSISFSHKFFY